MGIEFLELFKIVRDALQWRSVAQDPTHLPEKGGIEILKRLRLLR